MTRPLATAYTGVPIGRGKSKPVCPAYDVHDFEPPSAYARPPLAKPGTGNTPLRAIARIISTALWPPIAATSLAVSTCSLLLSRARNESDVPVPGPRAGPPVAYPGTLEIFGIGSPGRILLIPEPSLLITPMTKLIGLAASRRILFHALPIKSLALLNAVPTACTPVLIDRTS